MMRGSLASDLCYLLRLLPRRQVWTPFFMQYPRAPHLRMPLIWRLSTSRATILAVLCSRELPQRRRRMEEKRVLPPVPGISRP